MKFINFILIMLFLTGSLFAQDSVKTRNQNRLQKNRQTAFVDRNGDGINDSQEKRFQRMTNRNRRINRLQKRDGSCVVNGEPQNKQQRNGNGKNNK